MNLRTGITIFLLIISTLSHAQFGNPSNVANATVNTVVAALQTLKKNDVPDDSISGICSYKAGSCNGAQIVLYHKDLPIFEATLTSINPFKIPNLKRHERYTLKLTWAKHNLTKTHEVTTGEYITIFLSDK